TAAPTSAGQPAAAAPGSAAPGSAAPGSAAPGSAAPGSAQPATAAADAKQLQAGDPAPDVTLTLQNGKTVNLASLKRQQIAVYFYPKDDTPGCTVEAQGIRDDWQAFEKAGVKVFGVSHQDAASHTAFIEKHKLPFDLAVDTDGAVTKAFGVPVNGGEYAS